MLYLIKKECVSQGIHVFAGYPAFTTANKPDPAKVLSFLTFFAIVTKNRRVQSAGFNNRKSYLSRFDFANGLSEFRNNFKCIAYNTIIRRFEEWCFRILIDHYDYFASVYASQVLDCA